MNYFLTAFNRFKKDWRKIVLLDFVTLVLLVLVFVLVRNYLGGLVASVEGLNAGFTSLSGDVDQVRLAETIGNAEPIIFRYELAIYFILPLLLFLIVVVFQGASFGIAQDDKNIFNRKYLGRFAAVTLPGFLLGMWALTLLIDILSASLLSDSSVTYEQFLFKLRVFIGVSIAIIIIGYFTLQAYGMLLNNSLKKTLNYLFKFEIKKLKIFIPLFVAFGLVKLLVQSSFLFALFGLMESSIGASLVLFIASLLFFAYIKILNAVIVKEKLA